MVVKADERFGSLSRSQNLSTSDSLQTIGAKPRTKMGLVAKLHLHNRCIKAKSAKCVSKSTTLIRYSNYYRQSLRLLKKEATSLLR